MALRRGIRMLYLAGREVARIEGRQPRPTFTQMRMALPFSNHASSSRDSVIASARPDFPTEELECALRFRLVARLGRDAALAHKDPELQPKDFYRRVTVELWLYPDGSRIFEISTKCRPDEAFQVAVSADRIFPMHGSDYTDTSTRKIPCGTYQINAQLSQIMLCSFP